MSEPPNIDELKAGALEALAKFKSAVAVASVAPPATDSNPGDTGAPVTSSASSGAPSDAGNTVAADSGSPAAIPEPITTAPERLRELEGSVMDFSTRAVLAPFLPNLQGVLFKAVRPLVSLVDGRVVLRGDDGSISELTPAAVDALLGEARDHFAPSTGVSGTGSRPPRYQDRGGQRPAWIDSQQAFEKDKHGRR